MLPKYKSVKFNTHSTSSRTKAMQQHEKIGPYVQFLLHGRIGREFECGMCTDSVIWHFRSGRVFSKKKNSIEHIKVYIYSMLTY